MNRLRLIMQFLRESNDLERARYSSVILEFTVPDVGKTADQAVQKMYLGKPYREYRADGGELGLNGYAELFIVNDSLEEILWQQPRHYDGDQDDGAG